MLLQKRFFICDPVEHSKTVILPHDLMQNTRIGMTFRWLSIRPSVRQNNAHYGNNKLHAQNSSVGKVVLNEIITFFEKCVSLLQCKKGCNVWYKCRKNGTVCINDHDSVTISRKCARNDVVLLCYVEFGQNFFTSRRYAFAVSAAIVYPSVCPSHCLPVCHNSKFYQVG